MRRDITLMAAIGGLSSLAFSGAALAQTSPATAAPEAAAAPNVLQEVVVTAEKRSTNAQTTPVAMSVVTGNDLAKRQTTDIQGIMESLPSVHFGESEGMAQISIRGIGFDNVSVGGEARVAYHQDGVYLSRPDEVLGTLFDVSRIEVLRGPQGTLYGRNSTAGAINVITNDPTETLAGYVNATIGSYDLAKLEAALGGPLGDGFSGRIAVESVDRDGYGRDLATGAQVQDDHEKAVRAKLKYSNPSDAFTAVLAADYLQENDHSITDVFDGEGGSTAPNTPGVPAAFLFGGNVAKTSDPYDLDQNVTPRYNRRLYGVSLNASYKFDGFTLTSITGYRNSAYSWTSDYDLSSAPIATINISEKSQQESQELRLSRNFDNLHVDVGAYFFHEALNGYTFIPFDRELIGAPSEVVTGYYAGGTLDTTAEAVFFNLDYNFVPQWDLVFGGRYSNEEKSIVEGYELNFSQAYSPQNPIVPTSGDSQKASWSDFNPRVTLSYKPFSHVYSYLTYSTGFKSGGFNLGGLQPPFAPEVLTDYEGGVKIDWLQGTLRTNAAVFYYDYSNLQVSEITNNSVQIVNAARATLKGVEADAQYSPDVRWLFGVDASLLSSRYDTFNTGDSDRAYLGTLNLSGNQLTDAPPYKVDASAQYKWPLAFGDAVLRGDYSATGKVYFSPYNLATSSQKAYGELNASLAFIDAAGHWSVTMFVKNLNDSIHYNFKGVDSALVGFPIAGTLAPPRTFGITLGYKL